MPAARTWTDAQDTRIRRMRAEGTDWATIAAAFGVHWTTVRDRGHRIGARLPPPEYQPPAADKNRPSLAAGHPDTWGLLTAGTVLAGAPYDPAR